MSKKEDKFPCQKHHLCFSHVLSFPLTDAYLFNNKQQPNNI